MSELNFRLENQLLTKTTEMVIASGDVGAHTCIFEFDDSWLGYSKTAVFYQKKESVQYSVLDSDDSCVIPASAMTKPGIMYVGVFGVKGGTVLTSTLEQVEILQGAVLDGRSINTDPTDDIFISIISNYQAILKKLDDESMQYTEAMEAIKNQNIILETLNAFDVTDVAARMTEVEATAKDCKNAVGKNFRINDVEIKFDSNSQFRLEDERITSDTLVDVYFDTLSAPTAAEKYITVESFDGYIIFKTVYECKETLTASLFCMGV